MRPGVFSCPCLQVYGIYPDDIEFNDGQENDRAVRVETVDLSDYETCSGDLAREFTFAITEGELAPDTDSQVVLQLTSVRL